MKKILLTLALFTALFASIAQAAELKIAYVDLNKALNESDEGKNAVTILEDMVKAKQEVLNEKGQAIKALEDELAKQSSILTPEAVKEKKEAHEKLVKDYQRMVKDSQEDVQKKQSDFMERIIVNLRQLVSQMGKDEGYTAIFEKAESGILYFSSEHDLTDKLIKRFNETKKEVTTK